MVAETSDVKQEKIKALIDVVAKALKTTDFAFNVAELLCAFHIVASAHAQFMHAKNMQEGMAS